MEAVDSDSIILSGHARERARQMNVPIPEVVKTVHDPEQTYPQTKYGPRRRMHQRGRLAVPAKVYDDKVIVVTVLWNTRETFERSE